MSNYTSDNFQLMSVLDAVGEVRKEVLKTKDPQYPVEAIGWRVFENTYKDNTKLAALAPQGQTAYEARAAKLDEVKKYLKEKGGSDGELMSEYFE